MTEENQKPEDQANAPEGAAADQPQEDQDATPTATKVESCLQRDEGYQR